MMLLLSFPLAFFITIYCYFKHKRSFVAFTNKRVIVKPSMGKRFWVYYKFLKEIGRRRNYLHCGRMELIIRRFIANEGREKVCYIDGIQNFEFYFDFLTGKIPEVQDEITGPVRAEAIVLQ
eukprot:TRINITY_DN4194_c0_g1_i3.p1 TRINITY_DN4194_c0_g1~~TRINITY_DN4194_c0_g1_i3.p1  ORF type:complete len:121 (-),score=4.00 TRINITY_DN4194_c0_g1_i3:55-417(-)